MRPPTTVLLLLVITVTQMPAAIAQTAPSTFGPGETVSEKAERSLINRKLRALAQTVPICFAYVAKVSPGESDPHIASRFRFALGVVLLEHFRRHGRIAGISMFYSRREQSTLAQAYLFPVQEYIRNKVGELARGQIAITAEARDDLLKVAACPNKATILVHGNNIAFYYPTLPFATIWGGSVSIYDVIFVIVT